MKKLNTLLIVLFLLSGVYSTAFCSDYAKILVEYYSKTGHTRAMAEAVAKGARKVDNCTVRLLPIEHVKKDDIIWADAIVVGSPVYSTNVAPIVQKHMNSWPFYQLRDKIGAAFTTGGGFSCGQEMVLMSIIRTMLGYGLVPVGGPDWKTAFGAAAIVDEGPYKKKGTPLVDPYFLKEGEALGTRVAEAALRWKRGQVKTIKK